MTDSIRKTFLFDSKEGAVYSIRITNNTGDYIDLTNFGARLLGVHVHTPGSGMENIAPTGTIDEQTVRQADHGILFEGAFAQELSGKIWNIVDIDNTSVMFTMETASRIKIGLRITWVNLNRLIMDLFATPERTADITMRPHLDLAIRKYELACFCPLVNGQNVQDSAYADMAFLPLKGKADADIFSDTIDEIKPMFELKDTNSSLRISFYSTQHAAKAWEEAGIVSMSSFNTSAVPVQANETLTERAIWGFDHITADLASDENDPESPFLGFF